MRRAFTTRGEQQQQGQKGARESIDFLFCLLNEGTRERECLLARSIAARSGMKWAFLLALGRRALEALSSDRRTSDSRSRVLLPSRVNAVGATRETITLAVGCSRGGATETTRDNDKLAPDEEHRDRSCSRPVLVEFSWHWSND